MLKNPDRHRNQTADLLMHTFYSHRIPIKYSLLNRDIELMYFTYGCPASGIKLTGNEGIYTHLLLALILSIFFPLLRSSRP